MINEKTSIAFGPVPSRRLGKSLGINNIPPKICTYSCIYCQLGRTKNLQRERKEFYRPQEIVHSVEQKVTSKKDEVIDYLTFVPDGEPTLDVHLGEEIELLKSLGMNIAVITNSSLLSDKQVRDDLRNADWVSLKIDAISQDIWKNINRPHGSLQLSTILEGLVDFAQSFNGYLATETMLIKHTNDTSSELEKIARFLHELQPNKSYISIPTRPPAEPWVHLPTEKNLATAYHIFIEHNIPTEYLIGYEGNAFSSTGDLEEDILSITAVHPLREEGISELLKKTGQGWEVVEDLLKEKKIIETEHKNKKFYLRNLQKRT